MSLLSEESKIHLLIKILFHAQNVSALAVQPDHVIHEILQLCQR